MNKLYYIFLMMAASQIDHAQANGENIQEEMEIEMEAKPAHANNDREAIEEEMGIETEIISCDPYPGPCICRGFSGYALCDRDGKPYKPVLKPVPVYPEDLDSLAIQIGKLNLNPAIGPSFPLINFSPSSSFPNNPSVQSGSMGFKPWTKQ